MLLFKVTKSVRGFFKRTGWLVAEVVLVFLGMYGAFLLERMHDDEMDQLRKRQILQALVDEFANYEDELSRASHSLDEGYGIPFFTSYSNGEKPFPSPIPFGGMGSVNTGIWEAMLQSGGIEVLEVEMIQGVQGFFKKLQDLLDLYSRFERLSENLILPVMDESVDYFYEPESTELRNKYKWYVNSLFTVGMSLRELSAQAGKTKGLLHMEFKKTIRNSKLKETKSSDADSLSSPQLSEKKEERMSEVEETSSIDDLGSPLMVTELQDSLMKLLDILSEASGILDENYAVPFFNSYSNGECPEPFIFEFPRFSFETYKITGELLQGIKDDNFSYPKIPNQELIIFLEGVEQFLDKLNIFEERTASQFKSTTDLLFYENNSSELSPEFSWFANELFSLGTGLRSISDQSTEFLVHIAAKLNADGSGD